LNRRKFLKFGTVIVLLLFSSVGSLSLSLLASVQAATPLQSNQRILIKGTRFVFEDGSPFLFLGGNLAFYRFVVQRGEVYSKAEVDELVSNLATYTGAKMMRVGLAGGAFEPTLGNYDDRAFTQLDYVLAAARCNGIRVIIALRDYAWTPWPRDQQDPYWFLGGGTQSKPNKDAIILDPQAKEAYKHFIAYVLNRTNSVTSERYRDDSTVFAWDLLNDPDFAPMNDPMLLRSWVYEIGKVVKSMDQVHFVTLDFSGDQQWWDPGERNWRVFTNNPVIDFVAMHYYAPPSVYDPVDAANVAKIKSRIATALQLGKPLIVDEFGAEGGNPLKARINLYRTVIETALANGASGAMFWCWGPLGPNGWGGPGGWDIYVDQWPELTQLVLQESVKWTGFKPSTTTVASTTETSRSYATISTSFPATTSTFGTSIAPKALQTADLPLIAGSVVAVVLASLASGLVLKKRRSRK
jgi:mannan endo-1,4-beta-mannosidase